MTDDDARLTAPPTDPRALSLWLQHGAGFLLMREVREAMRSDVDQVPEQFRDAARGLVDATIYRLCMLVEGVAPPIHNDEHSAEVDLQARLVDRESGSTLAVQSMRDGDGMCVGLHGWTEGDFGDGDVCPVTAPAGAER